MARLLSVNVGLPRDIEWNGRTVRTAIWKDPVRGRCRVGRLNLEETVKATWPGTGVNSEPSSSTRSNRIATGSTS
jgi:MOSC domain-containing protein YiiM